MKDRSTAILVLIAPAVILPLIAAAVLARLPAPPRPEPVHET